MDSDENDNFEDLYDEKDAQKHKKLVEKVLSLNRTQHLKKPSRSEPTLKVSEFDLVKSVTGKKGAVQIDDLTKVLKSRKSRVKISEKVKKVNKNAHILPKPLEKPQADKIRRAVAYEKARLQLDRWEPIITSNRVSTNLQFPLDNDLKIEQKQAEKFPSMWRLKSEIDEELEKIKPKVEEYHIDLEQKGEFPLTMKEMLARRKEAAKLRAFQGYKEAKARRQNKIKSKKYHRIQKREKIKQQLKEFEQLQKTNPEEALKKLEEIEKARVEERFSLRHKSTGQWAKNKQIRAKYDKESRQVLSEQLRISKDLTQKLKSQHSDSEEEPEEGENNAAKIDKSNPWVNGVKVGEEVAGFISNYRKYWTEKNSNETELAQDTNSGDKKEIKTTENTEIELTENMPENEIIQEEVKNDEAKGDNIKKKKKRSKKKKKKQELDDSTATSEWEISVLDEDLENKNLGEIETIFNNVENKLQKQMLKNAKRLQRTLKIKQEQIGEDTKTKTPYKPDLSLPLQSKKPIIDEAMDETSKSTPNESNNLNISTLKSILDSKIDDKNTKNKNSTQDIDPNKYLNIKTTNLKTAIPDILTTDDNEEISAQREIISEAFEDDDIIQDFNKEKRDEIDKHKPKDINLNLPGWGAWGGAGVKLNKRKNRRFIIKAPPKIPRRDDNKGNLIINESAQSKIKELMVTEVPFPFTSVKDFEASIRAPIGNTFVPETAFKKLIKPAVTTKMGTIIKPMSREMLINR